MLDISEIVREELENEIRRIVEEDPITVRQIKEPLKEVIGVASVPSIGDEAFDWIDGVFRMMYNRQFISLVVKLCRIAILDREMVNLILSQDDYMILNCASPDEDERLVFVDLGFEAVTLSVVRPKSLIQAHNPDEVIEQMEKGTDRFNAGDWENAVFHFSKAAEGIGRYCVLKHGKPIPKEQPMMGALMKILLKDGFWTEDAPLYKMYDILKLYRNDTMHLEISGMPKKQITDPDTEESATAALFLFHLVSNLMLRRI